MSNLTLSTALDKLLQANLKVAFASSTCALDTNLLTGGGTDDTVNLQAAINAAAGGILVMDGPARISNSLVTAGHPAALVVPAYTTIFCPSEECGVFLTAASNCAILSNTNITGDPSATFDENISVIGGFWNGNDANQNKFEQADASNMWNVGFFFMGVRNLRFERVHLYKTKTFAFTVGNGEQITAIGCRAEWTGAKGNNNRDGFHMYGTLSKVRVRNFRSNGDDDVLAFNTDEAVYIHNTAPVTFANDRFSWSGGSITDVITEDVFCDDANSSVRFIGYATGTCEVDLIRIYDIYGSTYSNVNFPYDGVLGRRIEIDGYKVTGSNNINLGVANSNFPVHNAILNDIVPSASVNGYIVLGLGNYFTQPPLAVGVKFYYKLDENTGTTAGDSSPNNASGTLGGGASWGTGKINYGVVLAGSQYITSGAIPIWMTEFTISAWFKTSSATHQMIVDSRALSGNGAFVMLDDTGHINCYFSPPNTYVNSPAGGLADGAWHHVVISCSYTDQKLYVDGSLVASGTINNYPGQNGTSATIGWSTAHDATYDFIGTLDEIGMWAVPLNSEQSIALYNSGSGIQYPFGP